MSLFLGLAPEAVKLAREVIKQVKEGNAESAALLAKEAAERQALFAAGRKQLDG